MSSCGHDKGTENLNSLQLWLHARGLNKTGPVIISHDSGGAHGVPTLHAKVLLTKKLLIEDKSLFAVVSTWVSTSPNLMRTHAKLLNLMDHSHKQKKPLMWESIYRK